MKAGKSYIEHKNKLKAFIIDNDLKSELDVTIDIVKKARKSLDYSDKTVSLTIRYALFNHIQ